MGCQTRDGNLHDFFWHENQAWPPSLSTAGKLHLCSKRDILFCLEDRTNTNLETTLVTAVVRDGADIVQLLKPEQAKTFNEYADKDFIPSLLSQLRNGTRLDLVWDRCIADNLKGAARAKHGKGVC